MTAAAFPLQAVVLDGLTDAYWYRRAQVEGCPDCRASAGTCLMHENDNHRAEEYETAGHIIRHAAGNSDALAALARTWRGAPGRALAVLRGGRTR